MNDKFKLRAELIKAANKCKNWDELGVIFNMTGEQIFNKCSELELNKTVLSIFKSHPGYKEHLYTNTMRKVLNEIDDEIINISLTKDELDKKIDDMNILPFTAWSKDWVYFPAAYEDDQPPSIYRVPRNPCRISIYLDVNYCENEAPMKTIDQEPCCHSVLKNEIDDVNK